MASFDQVLAHGEVLYCFEEEGRITENVNRFYALNKSTIGNQVPLPRIDEVWDQHRR